MNQENKDEMRPEYDMHGGVRGKYLARYQILKGITTAAGPIPVNSDRVRFSVRPAPVAPPLPFPPQPPPPQP